MRKALFLLVSLCIPAPLLAGNLTVTVVNRLKERLQYAFIMVNGNVVVSADSAGRGHIPADCEAFFVKHIDDIYSFGNIGTTNAYFDATISRDGDAPRRVRGKLTLENGTLRNGRFFFSNNLQITTADDTTGIRELLGNRITDALHNATVTSEAYMTKKWRERNRSSSSRGTVDLVEKNGATKALVTFPA